MPEVRHGECWNPATRNAQQLPPTMLWSATMDSALPGQDLPWEVYVQFASKRTL
jgi:hypothetical protein